MFHVEYNERNFAAICFPNEGINPHEILTTSMQTKNYVQQFADQQVGDVKCAFNTVDDNLKNF